MVPGIITGHFSNAVRLVSGCELTAAASKSAERGREFIWTVSMM